MRSSLSLLGLIAAALVAAPVTQAQAVPGYNGNCTGCTADYGANGYYCADTNQLTCWASSGCGGSCVDCVAQPDNCPPAGQVPQFNTNCTGCTSSAGANGYYCADTNRQTCWRDSTCGGSCVDCVAFTQNCPPDGEVPQYNGNCSACTSSSGANGYYCADPGVGTCWTEEGCGESCRVCVAYSRNCPKPGELPVYNGNCTGCTSAGNGYYCQDPGALTCWATSDCGGSCRMCYAFANQCPKPGEVPQYNGNCTMCTGSQGANGYYCTASNTCWSGEGCGPSGFCPSADCIAQASSCPANRVQGNADVSGRKRRV